MNAELNTSRSEPGIPIKIKSGQPVCSQCGGFVQCSGTVTVSFVNVDANCYEDGGVDLTYDYMDAGSAEFVPTELRCVDCGGKLHDPGNLRCEDDEHE